MVYGVMKQEDQSIVKSKVRFDEIETRGADALFAMAVHLDANIQSSPKPIRLQHPSTAMCASFPHFLTQNTVHPIKTLGSWEQAS